MLARDVSQRGRSFKSLLFFHNFGMHGPLLDRVPRQLFMPRDCDTMPLYFIYKPSLLIWSGGAAVTEVKPLALTVPALILMEAHIIAHAIKEVQMLSGSAHIVISQCNTSLIVVVFLFFPSPHCSPPTPRRGGLDWKRQIDRETDLGDCGQMLLVRHSRHRHPPPTPPTRLKPRQRAHRKESNISQDHKVDLSHASKLPWEFKCQIAVSKVWSIPRCRQEVLHPCVTFRCSGPDLLCYDPGLSGSGGKCGGGVLKMVTVSFWWRQNDKNPLGNKWQASAAGSVMLVTHV